MKRAGKKLNLPLNLVLSGRRPSRRGAALIIALALVLAFTMIVASTQISVTQQLRQAKFERDYERALQMAEAGVNAYINARVNGAGTGANASLIPTPAAWPGDFDLSVPAFQARVQTTQNPTGDFVLTKYPVGSTTQGYCVREVNGSNPNANAAFINIIGYGWSNGVVRRVRVGAMNFNLFDWAAIWGLNSGTTNQDYAWKFSGNAIVIGGCGGEGLMDISNAGTPPEIYYGPLIWARNSFAIFNNPLLPVYTCAEQTPQFHTVIHGHTHGRVNPYHRILVRGLDFPTADQAANEYAGGTGGVDYFMANNHNATGFKMLARDTTTGVIRELPNLGGWDYPQSSNSYALNWPSPSHYTAAGITATEEAYGLRIYPGHYYVQAIAMTNSDKLFLRTFNDAERSDVSITRSPQIAGDPANPNAAMGTVGFVPSEAKDVRFWIGRRTSGNPQIGFDVNTTMEYSKFASRFRIYSASRSSISVQGRNLQNPPPPFRVNCLAYNWDADLGRYVGGIRFNSSVYLYGSLISWTVDVSGGTIIEKEAAEGGGSTDRLTYVITDWTELL